MKHSENYRLFELIAGRMVKAASSTIVLLLVFGFFFAWLVAGPIMHYSTTWQLLMTTVSAAITYFMVFLLARSQAKDSMAMQIKLNEIIAVLSGANNHLINIENLSEAEIVEMRRRYQAAAEKVHSEHPSGDVSTETLAVHEMEIAEEDMTARHDGNHHHRS